MVVVVVVVERFFPVNHALDVPKLLHVARDGDSSLLIKAILLLSLLEQLHEERVIYVYHRHHKPLLFLTLAHLDRQTPFWDVRSHHLPLRPLIMIMIMILMMMMMEMRQVQVEIP